MRRGLRFELCALSLAVDVVTVALVASGVVGPVRVVFGLVFASVVPGAAWLAFRAPRDVAGQLALVVALSWVTAVACTDVAAQVSWWRPTLVTAGLGAISGLVLAGRLVHDRARTA